MRIGSSIGLMAVGLILALAVHLRLGVIDLALVGWILVVVGIIGLVTSLAMARRPRTMVTREPEYPPTRSPRWPRFFIGVAGVALNYSLVILIMVCRLVGRAVGRLSRRCAGFHAPAGVFHDRRGDGMVVRSVRGSP